MEFTEIINREHNKIHAKLVIDALGVATTIRRKLAKPVC